MAPPDIKKIDAPSDAPESASQDQSVAYAYALTEVNKLREDQATYTQEDLNALDQTRLDDLFARDENESLSDNEVRELKGLLDANREKLLERNASVVYLKARFEKMNLGVEDWTKALENIGFSRGSANAREYTNPNDFLEDYSRVAKTGNPDEFADMKSIGETILEAIADYYDQQAEEDAFEVETYEDFEMKAAKWKGLSAEDWRFALENVGKEDIHGIWEDLQKPYTFPLVKDSQSLDDFLSELKGKKWEVYASSPESGVGTKIAPYKFYTSAVLRLLNHFYPNGPVERRVADQAQPETIDVNRRPLLVNNLRYLASEYGLNIPDDEKFFDYLADQKFDRASVMHPLFEGDMQEELFRTDSPWFGIQNNLDLIEEAIHQEFLDYNYEADLSLHQKFLDHFDELSDIAEPAVAHPDWDAQKLDALEHEDDEVYTAIRIANPMLTPPEDASELLQNFLGVYNDLPEPEPRSNDYKMLPVQNPEPEEDAPAGPAAADTHTDALTPEAREALAEKHKDFMRGYGLLMGKDCDPQFADWVATHPDDYPNLYNKLQNMTAELANGDGADALKDALETAETDWKADHPEQVTPSPETSTTHTDEDLTPAGDLSEVVPDEGGSSSGGEATGDSLGDTSSEDLGDLGQEVLENPRKFADIEEREDGSLVIQLKDSLSADQEREIRLVWILEACLKDKTGPAGSLTYYEAIKNGTHYPQYIDGKGFYSEDWKYCDIWKGDTIELCKNGGKGDDAEGGETATSAPATTETAPGTPEAYKQLEDFDEMTQFEDVEGFLTSIAAEVKGLPRKGRPNILEDSKRGHRLEERHRRRFRERLFKLTGEKSINSIDKMHVKSLTVDEKGAARLTLEYIQRPSNTVKTVTVLAEREKLFGDEPKERVPARLNRSNKKRPELEIDGAAYGVNVSFESANSKLNRRALRRLLRNLDVPMEEGEDGTEA